MTHWSEFLSAAIVHAQMMQYMQIPIDIAQLAQAIDQFKAERDRQAGLLGGIGGFDPRLINGGGLRAR